MSSEQLQRELSAHLAATDKPLLCDLLSPSLLQMPKGSDATFATKLQQQHTGNPRFESSAKAAGSQFSVNHYAGKVTYTTTKFLDKNRDTLSKGRLS